MAKKPDIVLEAHKRFKRANEAERDQRKMYLEDVKFGKGEHWPDNVKREREREFRPCLTLNRLPAFIAKLVSDARQNSPTIQVHPVGDEDTEIAEIYEGLIRQIEYQSNADQAFDTALEHAARGGIGAFRISTDYADDDSFDQDIKINRITNPMTVYWDPDAREYDKSDSQFCFVSEMLSKDEFETRYPKADPKSWDEHGQGDPDWVLTDSVRVAEYWVKEPAKKTLALLTTGQTVDITGIKNPPLDIKRSREVDCHKVVRYVLGGDEILEGPTVWPGKYIPIIGVFGPEIHVEGKVEYTSLIRYSKDAQRQYNYWSTMLTEKVALSPKAPWVGTARQFEDYESIWARSNIENRAYLPYNADPDAPGAPQRNFGSSIGNGEISLIQLAVDDLKATTGIFDASLGAQGNETSGRAILARQREGDAATFAWLDNLARSIRHAGRILVDLIPKIYDSERVIRVMGLDGQDKAVQINQTVIDPLSGEAYTFNDLGIGKYDVTISTGPSYQTQRMEAADSLMQFAQAIPGAAQVVSDLIAKNMDWPGADEIARRLKRYVRAGVLDPDDGDEPEPQGPDPEQQLEMAKAQEDLTGKQLDNADKQLELSAKSGELESLVRQQVEATILAMMQQGQQPIT